VVQEQVGVATRNDDALCLLFIAIKQRDVVALKDNVTQDSSPLCKCPTWLMHCPANLY